MFKLDQASAEWRRQMSTGGVNNPAVLDELEAHLREDVERQERTGVGAQEAFEVAVRRLGQAGAIRREFAKMRRQKAAEKLMIFICGVLIGLIMLFSWFSFFYLGMNPGQQILGLAGVALVLFYACTWRNLIRFLPVYRTRNRIAIALAGVLLAVLYDIAFGTFVLPHFETDGQLAPAILVIILGGFLPMTVLVTTVIGLAMSGPNRQLRGMLRPDPVPT